MDSLFCAGCGKEINFNRDRYFQVPGAVFCYDCSDIASLFDYFSDLDDLSNKISTLRKLQSSSSSDELKNLIGKRLEDLEKSYQKYQEEGKKDEEIPDNQKDGTGSLIGDEEKAIIDEYESKSETPFEDMVKSDIVLVTTDFVTGHEIKHMLGPVSECMAVGAGMLKSYFASWSATLGTKSNSFSKKFFKTRHGAEKAMLQEARELGANAVIDVHYAISNFASDLTGVLVTGTAVVIE